MHNVLSKNMPRFLRNEALITIVPSKPRGQMNRNLIGISYGKPSIKIAQFVPICYQTCPPQAMFVADWLISKIYSQPIEPLVLYIILYYMYMYANVPPYLSEFFNKIFKK